jgi:hypothetical protein
LNRKPLGSHRHGEHGTRRPGGGAVSEQLSATVLVPILRGMTDSSEMPGLHLEWDGLKTGADLLGIVGGVWD